MKLLGDRVLYVLLQAIKEKANLESEIETSYDTLIQIPGLTIKEKNLESEIETVIKLIVSCTQPTIKEKNLESEIETGIGVPC